MKMGFMNGRVHDLERTNELFIYQIKKSGIQPIYPLIWMGVVPPAIPIKTIWIRDRGGRFDVCTAEDLFDGDFDPVGEEHLFASALLAFRNVYRRYQYPDTETDRRRRRDSGRRVAN